MNRISFALILTMPLIVFGQNETADKEVDPLKMIKQYMLKITSLEKYKEMDADLDSNRKNYNTLSRDYEERIKQTEIKSNALKQKIEQMQEQLSQDRQFFENLSQTELESVIQFCFLELGKSFAPYVKYREELSQDPQKNVIAYNNVENFVKKYRATQITLEGLLGIYHTPPKKSCDLLFLNSDIQSSFISYKTNLSRDIREVSDEVHENIKQEIENEKEKYPNADADKINKTVKIRKYGTLSNTPDMTDFFQVKLEYGCGLVSYCKNNNIWQFKSYEGELYNAKYIMNILNTSIESLLKEVHSKAQKAENFNVTCVFRGIEVFHYSNDQPDSAVLKYEFSIKPEKVNADDLYSGVVYLENKVDYNAGKWVLSEENAKVISYPSWANRKNCTSCNGEGYHATWHENKSVGMGGFGEIVQTSDKAGFETRDGCGVCGGSGTIVEKGSQQDNQALHNLLLEY